MANDQPRFGKLESSDHAGWNYWWIDWRCLPDCNNFQKLSHTHAAVSVKLACRVNFQRKVCTASTDLILIKSKIGTLIEADGLVWITGETKSLFIPLCRNPNMLHTYIEAIELFLFLIPLRPLRNKVCSSVLPWKAGRSPRL